MGTVFIGTHEIKPNSFGYFHEKVSGHFEASEIELDETVSRASVISDSFTTLIGYRTLTRANKHTHTPAVVKGEH